MGSHLQERILGYLSEEEERKVIELTTLLTYYVVDGIHHFRN